MPRSATPILVLAYHFPPVGGGGVQRNTKFVRYLPSVGYAPTVVTGPGTPDGHWTPPDDSLLEEIATTTPIFRVPGPEPAVSEGRRGALERRLLLTSEWTRWWQRGAVATGVGAAPRGVELLYASVVPYDTARAAARLAHVLGVPWVADLQDPWALDETWLYPSTAHRAIDLRRMHRLLGTATAIVMNTPEAAARVVTRFPDLRKRLVVAIPNGFDQSDFVAEPAPSDPRKFRIVHTGYLHTDQGMRLREMHHWRRVLGGTLYPIDVLTRSHVFLLDAIAELVETDPSLASQVELVLAGVVSEADRRVASRHPFVTITGYVSHETAISYLRSADLAFLPMHDLPAGIRAGLVPGKTYEYLGSGRPILAAVPDGDARDLLSEAGNASLCRPADVGAMKAILSAQIERWRSGIVPPPPAPKVVARYERRHLTQQLAEVFDTLLRPDARHVRDGRSAIGPTRATSLAIRP